MKGKKKMSKNTKIEIRIDEEIKNKLQFIAINKGMSVSELIRQEIQKILNKEKGEKNERN